MRRLSRIAIVVVAAACALSGAPALTAQPAPKFFNDDPVRGEADTQDASKVARWNIDLAVDRVDVFRPDVGGWVAQLREEIEDQIDGKIDIPARDFRSVLRVGFTPDRIVVEEFRRRLGGQSLHTTQGGRGNDDDDGQS